MSLDRSKTLTASECVDVVLQLEPILREALGYGARVGVLCVVALNSSELEACLIDFSGTPYRRFWKCIHKNELQKFMDDNNRRIHV